MAPIPKFGLSTVAAAIILSVIFLIFILLCLQCIYAWCVGQGYMGRSSDQPLPQQLIIAIDPPRNGLDTSVIAALPTFVYKKPDDQIAGTTDECSICLSIKEEEEMVRLLPKCLHMFHSQCIDMWLSSHSTCPICRTNVIAEPSQAPPPPPVVAEQEESSSEAQRTTHGTTEDHEVLEDPEKQQHI